MFVNPAKTKLAISSQASASEDGWDASCPLNLATWVPVTSAEGPGLRLALWVQGCSIRCAHCCNPDMFSFESRRVLSVGDVLALILQAQAEHHIEGVTFLGGEPFDQVKPLALLAEQIQQHRLSVMVFSGYLRDALEHRDDVFCQRLLAATDILVDGPYLASQHTQQRRWIGSQNQQIHFLSDRYDPSDAIWHQPNGIEIHFDGQEIFVTGFPAGSWADRLNSAFRKKA